MQDELKDVHIRCIQGSQHVMRVLSSLQAHLQQWQQESVFAELSYRIALRWRRPLLVLLYADSACSTVLGGVMLYAYGGPLLGNRLLSNADRHGRVGVLGPAASRLRIATLATRFLVTDGAALVRLTFHPAADVTPAQSTLERALLQHTLSPLHSDLRWLLRTRDMAYDLTLYPSLDDTLAPLGKRTRRNVRAAMRKVEQELGCTFETDVRMTESEFLQTDARSTRSVSNANARLRYRNARSGRGFLVGLRTRAGEWIGLAGGRCVGTEVLLDWQTNDPAFLPYSVSLTMRGYLMQHFGRAGMHSLFLEGGTSHVMIKSFNKRQVQSLVVVRNKPWLRALAWVMTRWVKSRAVTQALFGNTALWQIETALLRR